MHPIFRREVYTIFLVQTFGLFTLVLFDAYVGLHLDNLKATALVLGVVFASRNLVQIFLRVPLSELSQSIGRKPLITSGIFCYACAHLLLYFARNWEMVLLAALLVGFGMSMHWPALFSYIGDISGKEYGRINGIILQGQDIGIIIGALMASYLLNHNIVTLRSLFLLVFVIGILGVLFTAIVLPEALDDEHRKHIDSKLKAALVSFSSTMKNLKELSGQHPLRLIFMFEVLITFADFFMSSFFPLLVVISFNHKDGDVAQIILLSTLISILLKPYLGIIFDKWGYRMPILLAMSNVSIMLVLLTYTSSFIGLLIIYTIISSSLFICFIATTGATSNAVNPPQRGLAMGVLGIYISSGRAISSIVLAPVLGIFEYTAGSRSSGLISLFRFTALLVFLIAVSIGWYSRSQNISISNEIVKNVS